MTYNEANKLSIKLYLESHNIVPAKSLGYYGIYHSPFREDHDASMKVDYNKNLWIDFGTNEGGTLIDLVMRMENCSNGEAIKRLEQRLKGTTIFSLHGSNNQKEQAKHTVQVMDINMLNHPALLNYLNKRRINIEIAKQYCSEVHYIANEKPYFAVGFRNDVGGWALRNEYFKGSILFMGATTYLNAKDRSDPNKEICLLFEGFMDFLSYQTLKRSIKVEQDAVILNSVANLSKVSNVLSGYRSISAFLDNDEGGRKTIQELQLFCKEVKDQSIHYANYKDLNDYLCGCSQRKTIVKKISKGRGL